ncbi:MAG TPA: molecular chaperone, partial [Gammaproteobacteria bacterium]|nr:molecular chaperone [Gammaproteobacteria bacterium]
QGRDLSFRLVVDELPAPDSEQGSGIELRLRYLVPLFARARDAAEPELACTLEATTLACRNTGGRPAQLGATRIVDDGGHSVALSEGLFGYLLPGTGRTWDVDRSRVSGLRAGLKLEAQINGQPGTVPVQRQP